MGKKKKDKKGKGAEKTAMKREKNAEKKMKKLVKEQGEEDIEALIAQFKEEDRKREEVIEEKCSPPSPRCNMTLVPDPDHDELILFGGQYCNGARTTMYNELYFYNIRNDEWRRVHVPNPPPPRCAHQAVVVRQGGGQMWVFGGEFESPKQLQFYHYHDLWLFHLQQRKWEKISAKGGPSSRSGHRMVACRKQLLVFGGFYDVGDYKYFNDVHAFNLETYTWTKLQPSGHAPAPRSGCVMSVLQDQNKIVIYGGYSREKSKHDADMGQTHTDMFLLQPESKDKDATACTKWKWVLQKQSGVKPTGRSGVSLVTTPGNRALMFGGVFDKDEDEEKLTGEFYNDMYSVELDKAKWHQVMLKGKKEKEKKKRRRKKQDASADAESNDDDDSDDDDVEDDVKRLKLEDKTSEPVDTQADVTVGSGSVTTFDDGIFSVTVGGATAKTTTTDSEMRQQVALAEAEATWPSPRMNALLAVKHGVLYLYGGLCEDGDRQITLDDFYSLDLHKLDEWKTIIGRDNAAKQEWIESESDDDDDEEDDDEDKGATGKDGDDKEDTDDDDGDDDDDDDDSDESDMDLGEPPVPTDDDDHESYFRRNKDFWLLKADDVASGEGLEVSSSQLKKAAKKMAREFLDEKKSEKE